MRRSEERPGRRRFGANFMSPGTSILDVDLISTDGFDIVLPSV